MNKNIFIIFLAITLPLFIIDITYLSGKSIQVIPVFHDNPVMIDITETDIPYSLKLNTGFEHRLETKFTNPSGQIVFHHLEIKAKSNDRVYFFNPIDAGKYQLEIRFIEIIPVGSVLVSVLQNDRRILPKILPFLH